MVRHIFAVQAWSETVMSPGADVYLRSVARGHGLPRITLLSPEAVVKSKNRDKFINSTVHIMHPVFIY